MLDFLVLMNALVLILAASLLTYKLGVRGKSKRQK